MCTRKIRTEKEKQQNIWKGKIFCQQRKIFEAKDLERNLKFVQPANPLTEELIIFESTCEPILEKALCLQTVWLFFV